MPIAAVPSYLGQKFEEASPGMRFGMYLKLWGEDHELKKIDWRTADRIWPTNKKDPEWEDADNKRGAIDAACTLSSYDKAILGALNQRQRALAVAAEHVFHFPAQSTAPFTTGLGNEHPLENGFSFLWPYGLPYLPGSGVKGVLRQAVRELLSGEWGDNPRTKIKAFDSPLPLGERAINLLFGLESEDHGKEHFRGVLSFWDVIPEIKGNKLMVEIMTPHQKHYYQGEGKNREGSPKIKPPHDSGQPTPISFLTVPPGSGFAFHVQCDLPRLQRIAPELAESDRWQTLLQAAFKHAFAWLGFGAKTAVGYGAMQQDKRAEQAHREAQEQARVEAAKRKAMEQAISDLPEDAKQIEIWCREPDWNHNNAFFEKIESLLENAAILSPEALQRLYDEMNRRWSGIMTNPDATRGKKNKPKYKDRQKKLAKALLALEPDRE